MNLSAIKDKIKQGISSGTDRILSAKLKDELGFNKPTIDTLQILSQSPNLENDLNSFFQPVNSTFLSSKDYKNIQNWALIFIGLISATLVLLFSSLIAPHKNYSNSLEDSQIVVKGSNLNDKKISNRKNKIIETGQETNSGASEDLTVENIILEETVTEDLAKNSPLLQSDNVTVIDYQIKAGDTLETIAQKFYGSNKYENVQKIKAANKISNARLLRAGQKLIVPM